MLSRLSKKNIKEIPIKKSVKILNINNHKIKNLNNKSINLINIKLKTSKNKRKILNFQKIIY